MFGIAYALGTAGNGGGGQPAGLMQFLPLIIIFVIFYFLLILPQQRKIKKHRDFLKELEKGKTVVTSSGIHGKITGLTDNIVTLEIAPNVKIKVSRDQVLGYSEIKSE
ncbi:MAG: preprotein translocase subunit YajC [Thermodesulfobacteriota bacterium]|jgi:protein translocase subunit yajC|nr:MAG: preprotein translocase subunit YajC [Thermodesulfobacteriota bacterium]